MQRLKLARHRCEVCGVGKRKETIDIHHLTYARIFEEEMTDLLVLCRPHHDAAEALIARGDLKRIGNVRTLRNRTVRALRPPNPKTGGKDIQHRLLMDGEFRHLLFSSPTRKDFKRALRQRGYSNRWKVNAFVIWTKREQFR